MFKLSSLTVSHSCSQYYARPHTNMSTTPPTKQPKSKQWSVMVYAMMMVVEAVVMTNTMVAVTNAMVTMTNVMMVVSSVTCPMPGAARSSTSPTRHSLRYI